MKSGRVHISTAKEGNTGIASKDWTQHNQNTAGQIPNPVDPCPLSVAYDGTLWAPKNLNSLAPSALLPIKCWVLSPGLTPLKAVAFPGKCHIALASLNSWGAHYNLEFTFTNLYTIFLGIPGRDVTPANTWPGLNNSLDPCHKTPGAFYPCNFNVWKKKCHANHVSSSTANWDSLALFDGGRSGFCITGWLNL